MYADEHLKAMIVQEGGGFNRKSAKAVSTQRDGQAGH